MQQPPATLETGFGIAADRPSQRCTDEIACETRQGHRHVRRALRMDLVAERDHAHAFERARRKRAGVEHRQLARRGQDRGDHHQDEDRVEAVVPDQRRDRARDAREHHRRLATSCRR